MRISTGITLPPTFFKELVDHIFLLQILFVEEFEGVYFPCFIGLDLLDRPEGAFPQELELVETFFAQRLVLSSLELGVHGPDQRRTGNFRPTRSRIGPEWTLGQ